MTWTKREVWRQWSRLSEGGYLLRSDVTDWKPEELWWAYIQLTEAEAAFLIQKSGLPLRPVWHQNRERLKAHILEDFWPYVVWKTLRKFCSRAGSGEELRNVFDEIGEIAEVGVVRPTRKGVTIRKRCVTKPTPHQQILLMRRGLRLPVSLAASGL